MKVWIFFLLVAGAAGGFALRMLPALIRWLAATIEGCKRIARQCRVRLCALDLPSAPKGSI